MNKFNNYVVIHVTTLNCYDDRKTFSLSNVVATRGTMRYWIKSLVSNNCYWYERNAAPSYVDTSETNYLTHVLDAHISSNNHASYIF